MGALDGKVAIVTGSSRGVGHFMAQELARAGCNIVVAARSEQVSDPKLPGTIHSVAEELRGMGVDALPVRLDVSREEEIAAGVAKAVEHFGRIDVLVNNAAIMVPARVLDLPLKRLDLIYRVDVRGPFAVTQAVLPQMLTQGGGTIITISSVAADRAGGGNVAYAMAKIAMEKFMAGLAEEVGGQGIRCFGLKPEGLVLSPGATYHGIPGRETDIEDNSAMGRAAVWLIASAEAGKHNGESFYSRAILRAYVDG